MYEYFAFKKYLKSKAGLTVMEILICMVVLSILAAIGIPIYINHTKKANETVCLENQRIIYSTIDSILTAKVYSDGNKSAGSKTDLLHSAADIEWFYKQGDKNYIIIRYEKKTNLSTGKTTEEITTLPINESDGHTYGVYFLFNATYQNFYGKNGGYKSGAAFLKTYVFDGDLPYCPLLVDEGDKDGYHIEASEIKVVFELDDEKDPYIYSVGCASHGTTTYHAP